MLENGHRITQPEWLTVWRTLVHHLICRITPGSGSRIAALESDNELAKKLGIYILKILCFKLETLVILQHVPTNCKVCPKKVKFVYNLSSSIFYYNFHWSKSKSSNRSETMYFIQIRCIHLAVVKNESRLGWVRVTIFSNKKMLLLVFGSYLNPRSEIWKEFSPPMNGSGLGWYPHLEISKFG